MGSGEGGQCGKEFQQEAVEREEEVTVNTDDGMVSMIQITSLLPACFRSQEWIKYISFSIKIMQQVSYLGPASGVYRIS